MIFDSNFSLPDPATVSMGARQIQFGDREWGKKKKVNALDDLIVQGPIGVWTISEMQRIKVNNNV